MKKIIFLIITTSTLLGCTQSTTPVDDQKQKQSITDTIEKPVVTQTVSPIIPGNLFTLSDAEKILGESGHLSDSSTKTKGKEMKFIDSMSIIKRDASIYSCGFMANAMDKKTKKTGIVYFMFEQYPDVSSAKQVYSFYKKANVNAIGFKELNDLGEEAWFGSSPLFIYVRKGDKIFVMKVNKMTSLTSLNEFNLITKKITDAL